MKIGLSLLFLALVAANPSSESTATDQLAALATQGTAIHEEFYAELKKAGRDMPRVTAANEKYRTDATTWAKRAMPLLTAHPAEPAALDVILAMNEIHHIDDKVVAILREHHFASPNVLKLVYSFSQDGSGSRRQFAEDVAEKHPDRTVRGKATLTLGRLDRIYLIDGLKKEPSFGGRLGTPDVLRKRARTNFERVTQDYAEIISDEEGESLGTLAKDELAGLDNAGRLEVGQVAPDVVGEDLDAKPLTLNFKGDKVTLMVFWGTWCGPCMRLVPHEIELLQKYKGRPFQLYGVNGGDERDVAKKTTLDKQMTWPSFYGGRIRGGLAAVWNVDAWPAVYVIGPDGVIRYKGHGDGIDEAVEKAVAEAEKGAK